MVTPVFQLRRLQSHLLDILLDREDEISSELDRLASIYPLRIGRWLEWRRADLKQRALLGAPDTSDEAVLATMPEPHEVVQALVDDEYRLVRNGLDLLEIVEEELAEIADSIEYDLDLFYFQKEKGDSRTPRREDILQAYIRTRLNDRLHRRLLLDREVHVKLKRRIDIRVTASTGKATPLASVAVEVKWSSSSDSRRGVSTGLRYQLGQDYLVKEGKKYGLFLVAWNGKLGSWKDETIKRPEKTAPGLRDALKAQALAVQQENPGLDVRAVVMDLQWRRA